MPRSAILKARPQGPIKAWWVEPSTGVLGYGDGRTPRAGITHTMRPSNSFPKRCFKGMHASVNPLDALDFHTESDWIWAVELSGDIDMNPDDTTKIAARRRRYIKRINVREILNNEFRRATKEIMRHIGNKRIRGLTPRLRRDLAAGNLIGEDTYPNPLRDLFNLCECRYNTIVIVLQALHEQHNMTSIDQLQGIKLSHLDYWPMPPRWHKSVVKRIRRAIEKEAP